MLILAAILFYSYEAWDKTEVNIPVSISEQNDKGMTVAAYMKKVSANDKLVLVYFHASWCMPCLKLKPEIEALEAEEISICEVLKIDTDENPKIAEHFEINSLPMFFLYKKGQRVWETTGYQSKSQLIAKIDAFKKD